jgi:hypothetical protein
MDKIRRAAAELASAFSTLGAFGTASRVSCVYSVNPGEGIAMCIASYRIVSCAPEALVLMLFACILLSIFFIYLSLYPNITAATRL